MKSTLLSITVALAIPAGICFAQTPPATTQGNSAQSDGPGLPPGPPPPHPPMLILMALDADADGIISAAEIEDAPAALKALDKNGDGQLTREELMPPPPPRPPGQDPAQTGQDGGAQADQANATGKPGMGGPGHGHHGPPPLIAALDADHDGVISAVEIQGAPAALKALDKNGDGQLGPLEYGPRPPHGPCPPPDAGSRSGSGGGNETSTQ